VRRLLHAEVRGVIWNRWRRGDGGEKQLRQLDDKESARLMTALDGWDWMRPAPQSPVPVS
jgi:hypothetical protein